MAAILETARAVLGGGVAAAGVCALVAGAIGMLRFPDFYTRLHAANAGHVLGAPLVLLGLVFLAHDMATAVRLLLLLALILALAPVTTHLLANAAHAAGLAPATGKYVAPRPGARRS